MNKLRINLIAGLTLLVLGPGARASLKWEQTQIDLNPKPGEASVTGSFKYKNEGEEAVHIKSVHTSCGCTTASRQKDEIAPGESGEIAATFHIGSSTGLQQKTVQVETDDAAQPFTVLTLRALIPQMIEMQPTFVYWQNNERAKPKTITVKTAKQLNVKSLSVSSSSPAFETKVAANGSNEFKIQVQPRDTSHEVNATLTVRPDNGAKTVYALARVVSPANSSQ